MSLCRVVVTGVGAISPLGNCAVTSWEALLQGKNGVGRLKLCDPAGQKTRFAAEIKDFQPEKSISARNLRRMDRNDQLGVIASTEAIRDAALDELDQAVKDNIGVIWGSGIGGVGSMEKEIVQGVRHYEKSGMYRISPGYVPKMIINMIPGWISILHGLRGPNFATVSACASSSYAIATAANFIRTGQVDVIVTGGSEASLTPVSIAGFSALRALSERNEDFRTASRPFDKDRDGFVMGEGAAGMILESYTHAKARGAKVYAELLGAGMSADAHHMTAPHPEGLGIHLSMERALKHANVSPESVKYINAHATSTPLGDVIEAKAIQKIFGTHKRKIFVGATKSMTGHMLGAAGAFEALATTKVVQTGRIPPTINTKNLDDSLDPTLDYCLAPPPSADIEVAISNSFGFGGHNATLVFGKCEN